MANEEIITDRGADANRHSERLSRDEKFKQFRVPRNYESIEKGALSLTLSERVTLRNKLTESIDDEVKDLETQLSKAKEIVSGK